MRARGAVGVWASVGSPPSVEHRDDGEGGEEEEEGVEGGSALNEESISPVLDVGDEQGGGDLRMVSQQGSVWGVGHQVKVENDSVQSGKVRCLRAWGNHWVEM